MTAEGRALKTTEDFDHPSWLIRSLSAGRRRWTEVLKNGSCSDIREKRKVPRSKRQTSVEQQWRKRLGPCVRLKNTIRTQ